ncbi:MAG: EamA family transporter [Candidatus Pacearchaeota archaeon]
METSVFIILLLVLFCALLGASGQLLFKLASTEFSFNPLTWFKNFYFLLGILFYAIATVLFVWALKHGNLSILYPIIATSYIWVTIFASVLLKEPFTPLKWIGIGLIVAGVILIAT